MNWVSERIESFIFDKEQEDRLDHFLVRKLSEFSRSRLQNLIKEGFVNVNGIPVKKTGQKLELGQTIEITIPAPVPSELVGEQIPLDIVYESEDVLIVDKPAGMVVHPAIGCKTNFALARWKKLILLWWTGNLRPRMDE